MSKQLSKSKDIKNNTARPSLASPFNDKQKITIINIKQVNKKLENLALSGKKENINKILNSRPQSTGIFTGRQIDGKDRKFSLIQNESNSKSKNVFHRNNPFQNMKETIYQGILIKSTDVILPKSTVKPKTLLEEVNWNLEKLKIGTLSSASGNKIQKASIKQQAVVKTKTNFDINKIMKTEINKIEKGYQSNKNSLFDSKIKEKQKETKDNIEKSNNALISLTHLNSKLNQTNPNGNATNKQANSGVNSHKNSITNAVVAKPISNIRKISNKKIKMNFLDKEKENNRKSVKNETNDILKNIKIENSTALDNLLQKNNKIIEKITGQTQVKDVEEITYPIFDYNRIGASL